MILILTELSDSTADVVAAKLHARGRPFLRFAPSELGARAEVAVRISRAGVVRLMVDDVDLAQVAAAWYRRPGEPTSTATDETVRSHVAAQWRVSLVDLWGVLRCRWLPGPPPILRST